MTTRLLARAGIALAAAAWIAALPADAAPRQATPTSPQATLSAGYAALEAGRFEEAAAIAAKVLAGAPGGHAATLLQISALAYGADPLQAVAAYDSWRQRHGVDDPLLLGVIGEGVARHLAATASDPGLRLAAAELLVDRGTPGARARMATIARAAGSLGTATLARTGEEAAARQAAAALPNLHGSAKTAAIEHLAGASDPAVVAALNAALGDQDPMVRIAAAGALSAGGDPASAAPALERLLEDPSGQVQRAAAVALVKLGQPSGEPLVETMLASGVGDLVLAAAEALPNAPERWSDRVRPLLDSEDPVERLRAAGLLRAVSPAEAAAVVGRGLADENLALREEAARVALEGVPLAAGSWRVMVQDPNGWVRLAGARILLTPGATAL
jgi:HEAT repeat protein